MIESIPNVSEGRRQDVIEGCAGAIRATPARLLDVSSDASHNRSVYTFVGEAPAVEAAVLALFERAIQSIDLRVQTGEHPRLGAVDVVPFVPLAGATMAECVALARRVGAEVAQRFHIPVFLYEEAAARWARRHLEHIRRGQFEGLATKLGQEEWQPDFGPAVPHPTAGATVIGARGPLIAYNVNLHSADLEAARAIARAVRQSSGGLPCVKAMGVALPDRSLVQVSMNLTNYEKTSMLTAFEAVRREAERRGIAVANSEIVGLVPAAALPDGLETVLMLEGFRDDLILENRIRRT